MMWAKVAHFAGEDGWVRWGGVFLGGGTKLCTFWANQKIGLVAHLLNYREDCLAFWLIIPPLLIVPSLACSVTSLSLCSEP